MKRCLCTHDLAHFMNYIKYVQHKHSNYGLKLKTLRLVKISQFIV